MKPLYAVLIGARECATNGGYIGQPFKTQYAFYQRVVDVVANITKLAKPKYHVDDQQQHDLGVSEDRGHLHVTKAATQARFDVQPAK